MKIRHFLSAVIFFAACVAVHAKVTLPSVISDNMVLQQQTGAALWGKAEPGRKVTVKASWNNAKVSTTAKREVGQRLAWLALQHDYGFDSIRADAPTYRSVEFKDGKAYVLFDVDDLLLAGLEVPQEGFEIAGADKVFHKADAVIDNRYYRQVVVSSPEVPEPVAVRYCFRNWCKGSLHNNFGIPAAPFRTDDWQL